MDLNFALSLRHLILCRVCGQDMASVAAHEAKAETRAIVALFGAAPYAICPCCGQRVPSPGERNYRRRARRFAAKCRS